MKRKIFATFCALVFSAMLTGCGNDMGNDISSDISSIMDPNTNNSSMNENSNTATETKISKEKAKEIAIGHASIKESEVTDYEIDLDTDEDVHHYDISFKHNNKEYNYNIHAQTGEILNDEDKAKITREKAKETALQHADIKESETTDLEIELEYDNGALVYDISFESNGKKYDYDVNAETGKITNSKNELID